MLKFSMMYHESLFTTGEEVIQFIYDILVYAMSLHLKICSEEKSQIYKDVVCIKNNKRKDIK